MSDHLPECPKRFLPPKNTGVCVCRWLQACEERVRDEEARAAADRVEALPWLDDGRTVNRNNAILAARRGLPRRGNK